MSRQKPDEQLTTEDLPADPILRAYALLAREVAAAVDRFHARLAEPDGRGWPTPPAAPTSPALTSPAVPVGVLTVEAARAVLAEHQVDVDWYRRRDGYAWSCSCLTDGEDTHRTAAEAWQSAAGHQAEQLVA